MTSSILTLCLAVFSSAAYGQFGLRPATSGQRNEIGVGLSYGIKLDKEALFVGYAPDYVRVLNGPWLLNVSLAYDEETETKNGATTVTETWTPAVMIGRQFGPRLAFGGGIGHGLRENKDGAGWQSVKLGDDVSIAAAVAITLWSKGRHGLALSVSLEHSISDNENSISTDIGYAWGF